MPGGARCGSDQFNKLRGDWFKCDGCKKNLCTLKNGASYSCEGPIHCTPCMDKFPRCQYCYKKSHHKTFECVECKSVVHENCPFTGLRNEPGDDKCIHCLEIEQAEMDAAQMYPHYDSDGDSDTEVYDPADDPSAWQNYLH